MPILLICVGKGYLAHINDMTLILSPNYLEEQEGALLLLLHMDSKGTRYTDAALIMGFYGQYHMLHVKNAWVIKVTCTKISVSEKHLSKTMLVSSDNMHN